MEIKREKYLKQLIAKRKNRLVKVVTGVRRSGKSYLLNIIYKRWLIDFGIEERDIIYLSLDDSLNARYRNPLELDSHIRKVCADKSRFFYVFIDEIQMAGEIDNPYLEGDKITFVSVLLSLMKIENIDLYVTGSNSRMLSKDIVTEFRDKGDEIKVFPLTFKEYKEAIDISTSLALSMYMRYGGLPRILSFERDEEKINYLKNLFERTYKKDVIERGGFEKESAIVSSVIKVVSSSLGSLVNTQNISSTFQSVTKDKVGNHRVSAYLDEFEDAFVLTRVSRESVKGRKHIGAQYKYYFSDLGIRNAILDFHQTEETNLMENLIYNELVSRGYAVSIGNVEYFWKDEEKKTQRTNYEIDFIAEKGMSRIYIQSAYMIPDREKREKEIAGLIRIRDSFKKIVVVKDEIIPYYDENGIFYLSLSHFLLDESAI